MLFLQFSVYIRYILLLVTLTDSNNVSEIEFLEYLRIRNTNDYKEFVYEILDASYLMISKTKEKLYCYKSFYCTYSVFKLERKSLIMYNIILNYSYGINNFRKFHQTYFLTYKCSYFNHKMHIKELLSLINR